MSRSRPPAGMFDLVGPDAERHEAATEALRGAFRRYGFQPVIPPVVERAEHFLDRTGEDIRSRMYLFTDPGGREVCLRPELTIPTVRLYADQYKGDGRLFRGYYVGPVFRYDTRSEGRYRQFTQAGAELIGEADADLADAEILAAARHALESCGLGPLLLTVSDISFFTSLIEAEVAAAGPGRAGRGLSETLASRLRALATDPVKLAAYLDRTGAGHEGDSAGSGANAGPEQDGGGLDFLASLAAVPPAERRRLVTGIVRSLQGAEPFGTRTIADITERALVVADTADRNRLPEPLATGLRELLAVDAPLVPGLEAIAALAQRSGAEPLAAVVAGWRRKLELFDAFGLDTGSIRLGLRTGRGIDYYSSFVFEIAGDHPDYDDQLCTGGRYDDLVQYLGGRNRVPAVGFAIGVERVLLALADTTGTGRNHDTSVGGDPTGILDADGAGGWDGVEPGVSLSADVIVVSGGDVPDTDVVRVTAELRHRGLRAVLLSGRRVRYGLTQALKNGVPYLAVVGPREAAAGLVTLRHLATRTEGSLPLAQVAAVVTAGAGLGNEDEDEDGAGAGNEDGAR